MFRWHKEMSRLDIPAQRVLRLERSLSDVQVALPGLPAQETTAYLCGFASGQGIRVAVVLYLKQTAYLAFYLNEDGEVEKREAARVYNQALDFAESMGFMFGDLDIHLCSDEERIALWRSLPLQGGVASGRTPVKSEVQPAAKNLPMPGTTVVAIIPTANPQHQPEDEMAIEPDAAAGKSLTAAELSATRERLLHNLGRFLGSF